MKMQGKICLVTGSTSGIGKEIAAGLARMGATVVLVGRSKEKCESAIQDILAGGASADTFSYISADLSSQKSVRQLVREFVSNYDKLHVLVNNAGVFMSRRELTVDGIE
jgi:NAD(P)-dependent dehydrogenase (short-subunit alcohol dehydrogenase family)